MSEARARALLIERIKRERMRQAIRNDLFDRQLQVYDDPAQFRANHTGRRGGKSHEMPDGCLLDVLDAGFNEAVILAAETQKKAKALHWANLTAASHKFGVPLRPAVQEGAFLAPWGARIQFWGINDDGAVELLRGFKMRSFRGDECFPAGTLVDGKPIEQLRVGDLVWSVDHNTGLVERLPVLAVTKKVSPNLVSVSHEHGDLICTGNHPVFVKGRGYVDAKEVVPSDLLCVRSTVQEPTRPRQDVLQGLLQRALPQDSVANESDVATLCASEGVECFEGTGPCPACSPGQWHRPYGVRGDAGVSASELLGPWSLYPDGKAASEGSAHSLQARPGLAREEACHRSGRSESLHYRQAGPGPEEGTGLVWSRVDRVESVQRGRQESVVVYNLEVERGHTYFASGVLVHNCQTYSSKIPRLVSSVLEPALGDTGGTCTLYGTPSVTRSGPWADICLGNTPGWSVHHWDVRQNKKFPRDAESLLQQVLLRNKWDWDHPTFQREWLGNFVNDSAMQVYKFDRKRNTADCLPLAVDRGFTTLGIDYGTTDDPCAWTVLWSPRGSREIYVVEAHKHYGMLPDDAAVMTKALIERWKPRRIVGDAGGLGAPYVEAYNRRYGHISEAYVHAADKQGKLGHIAIFNGELESGRIKVLPAAEDLAHEMEALPWANEKKIKEDDGFDNHCTDAGLYCLVDHMTDIPTKPKVEPTQAERIAAEVAERKRLAAQRGQRGLLRRA